MTATAPKEREEAYWLALARGPAALSRHLPELLERFGSPRVLFEAGAAAWRGYPEAVRSYLAAPDWAAVERDLAWPDRPGHHLLAFADPRYPPLLREIPGPPPVLFVRGDPAHLSRPQIAIVGSRNPTLSGRDTGREFARHFAGVGLVVTSGLALGVDAAAHQGALAVAGGCTVAVTGSGLDRIYPASHRDLAEAIAEGGALVSEFAPGTPPLAANFPRRNRILTGLSLGTLVVEAAVRSGSLISARLAVEQGREVFAIPGSIHNPLSRGCHRLIREGAKLVETAEDVLEELAPLAGVSVEAARQFRSGNSSGGGATEALDELQLRVLEAVGYEPTAVDLVVVRTGLTPDAVCSMLLVLELHGLVASTPGGHYSRAR